MLKGRRASITVPFSRYTAVSSSCSGLSRGGTSPKSTAREAMPSGCCKRTQAGTAGSPASLTRSVAFARGTPGSSGARGTRKKRPDGSVGSVRRGERKKSQNGGGQRDVTNRSGRVIRGRGTLHTCCGRQRSSRKSQRLCLSCQGQDHHQHPDHTAAAQHRGRGQPTRWQRGRGAQMQAVGRMGLADEEKQRWKRKEKACMHFEDTSESFSKGLRRCTNNYTHLS